MDIDEFDCSRCKRFQVEALKLCAAGTLTVFLFQAFYISFKIHQNALTNDFNHFLISKLVIPSSINILATILCAIVLKLKKASCTFKNYFAAYTVFTICSVVSIFHVSLRFMLVTTGLPLIICAFFSDRKMISAMLASCFVTLTASIFMLEFETSAIDPLTIFMMIMGVVSDIFLSLIIALMIIRVQEERKTFIQTFTEKQNSLIRELKIEPLTKLYNRVSLSEASKSFIKKFQSGLMKPHLVIIDITNLKDVNELFTHKNGDKVLIIVAELIKSNMGGIRRAFRISGEKFALLFERESTDQVIYKVNEIKDDVAGVKFDFSSDLKISLTAGIAKLRLDWDEISWLNAALLALCNAKAENPSWIIDYDSIPENVSDISVE